jgi:hypothetical protein
MIWRFFVYAYFRPNEESPFYIGKGSNKRDLDHMAIFRKGEMKYNRFFESSLSKLQKQNVEPKIVRLAYFKDEQDAYIFEEQMIKEIGRRIDKSGLLDNIDPGFRNRIGFKGKAHSKETIIKMTGIRRSDKTKERMRKPKSLEHCKKIKVARLIRVYPWLIQTPDLKVIKVLNLNQFCKENDLSSTTIYR